MSCGLLIAAGLMVKSVVQLRNVQMPFAIENVLTARVDLPRAAYPDSAASIRFFERLLPKLQSIPGVEAATLSDGLPAAGNGAIPVQISGKAYAQTSDYPLAREGIVTSGYFDTFQTRLLSGREFLPSDVATSQPVAIVNASFARAHFPNLDALGRQFKRIRPGLEGAVADDRRRGAGPADGRHRQQQREPGGLLHSDRAERRRQRRPHRRAHDGRSRRSHGFRARGRRVARPDLAIYDVSTMRVVIDRQTWFYTMFGTFFMAFGFCALFLASAGLYGVMSFAVTQRTREMGVRSALGANGRALILLIMRKSVVQLAIGLALGLGLALLASGALQPVLYHVDPRDGVVFAAVAATLACVSLAASLLPARRVTRIDPALALSSE